MTKVQQPDVTYRPEIHGLTCGNIGADEVIAYCDDMQERTEAAGFSTLRALSMLASIALVAHRELKAKGDDDGAARESLAYLVFLERLQGAAAEATANLPVPYALARAAS